MTVLLVGSACGANDQAATPPQLAASTPTAGVASPTTDDTTGAVAGACLIGPRDRGYGADRTDQVEAALVREGFTTRRVDTTADRVSAAVAKSVGMGCALVLSVADELGPAVARAAAAHPGIPVAATGLGDGGSWPANVAAISFDRRGAAFVAGDLAARTTSTKQVGAIGLRTDPSADDLIEAFAAGVGQAGDAVHVLGGSPPKTVGDPGQIRRQLTRWMQRGADVAFLASPDTAAPGVINESAGGQPGSAAVIGVGPNRATDALAWIVEVPAVPALAIAQAVADGVFTPAPIVGSLTDGAVAVELGDVPRPVRTKVEAVELDVASGRMAID